MPFSPVLLPAIVRAGTALPCAPAAYTSTDVLVGIQLVTYKLPLASNAIHVGEYRPVLLPAIESIGAALPRAPGA